MNTLLLGIIIFILILAVFDLTVGVSNDAVNFLNSAIGAKVASFRTIVFIAAVGLFVGAAMSNGMMDVARHGIMTPQYFSFRDVMCVFLAVMLTDIVLINIYNTLGMPTSTTVSMVFELLGGTFAIALIQITHHATSANGTPLTLGDMLNTEKALSVILAIFLSVAVAFTLGVLVQWIARLVFSFTYRVNGKTTDASGNMGGLMSSAIRIGIFGGLAVTGIIWFLLIEGLKGSSIMTPEIKGIINDNTWWILGGGGAACCVIMTILSACKWPVLRFVVLLGTFALAMAFAGNDLVNFLGVPLTALEAYIDFTTNGMGNAEEFKMTSLMESAHTPTLYLILAGVVMGLVLIFSKKAQNVVKTSVDLSRQDEGDEMFGSSGVARVLVRNTQKAATVLSVCIPQQLSRWVDTRFNADVAVLPEGAAFDQIRASVNLVLAGLLVAMGTSMKLPLSTTYVTFMVAMGSSLADRAWSRESAVFRITGVLSVIGGWLITAGAAFVTCFLLTNILHYGSFMAMGIAIAVSIAILIQSNLKFKKSTVTSENDVLFKQLCSTQDKSEKWLLLRRYICQNIVEQLQFSDACFQKVTDAFLQEEYRPLRQATHEIETARKQLKRARRREIIGLREIDPLTVAEKNTWYWISGSNMEQMFYCLKRMNDTCREHVGNNFTPTPREITYDFLSIQMQFSDIFQQAESAVSASEMDEKWVESLRKQIEQLQDTLKKYRNHVVGTMQQQTVNIESTIIFVNVLQESHHMLSCLRHMLRGVSRFTD